MKKRNEFIIHLTKNMSCIVDEEDFNILNKYKWYYQNRGYACNDKLGLLHRFIMQCPRGLVVDHINGDKLDNRKSNLRICTQRENTFNSNGSNKTSKYKGVSWCSQKHKWKAQICINKKNTYLGLFLNEIDAARKYDKIAILNYKDFSKLNFPK